MGKLQLCRFMEKTWNIVPNFKVDVSDTFSVLLALSKVHIDLHKLMSHHYLSCVVHRALGVPITDYSFEDCQLAMAEGQLRLPVDTCLLEFAKLVRRLGWVIQTFQGNKPIKDD